MGNRAVITNYVMENETEEHFEQTKNERVGIYVHWNGGRESIEAFLKYCELRGFRPTDEDNYGWARLCQVIANFFEKDGLSIGIDTCSNLDCDNWDNGVYLIGDWKIKDRLYFDAEEKSISQSELAKAIIEIDKSQPYEQQIGKEGIMKLAMKGVI